MAVTVSEVDAILAMATCNLIFDVQTMQDMQVLYYIVIFSFFTPTNIFYIILINSISIVFIGYYIIYILLMVG